MTGSFAALRAFHWRTRSFLLFGAGATALAAGVLVARPALLYLALPLLLAPVAAALLGPSGAPTARMHWGVEGSGPDVRVAGTISFDPPTDVRDIGIEFEGPPGLREVARPEIARSGHEIRFRLHWTAPEPVVVPVPFPRLTWRDPAGLVEREVRWNPSDLLVERYPAELVHIGAVRLERTIAAPGETRSRRIGPDGEFFGIRYASPFEPPRRINWPATARTGQLMVNEFQLERTGDILLLIDTRPSTLGPWVDTELLSLSVAAAYGIAESFLREKARVGLGVYGEFLDAVPLSAGRTQRVRLRNALMRVRLSRNPGPTERCAVSLRRYFPPGVTTILLSSLVDNESRYLVPYIRRRGFPVVVLSPSALPILTARPTLSASDEELVTRMARLLRRDRLARTWEDAPVVDWEEYWSLGGLVDILRRPGRRGRVI
ncbi:MAG: DUF58 domain-containing protein [Thermoplasmata archaeon]